MPGGLHFAEQALQKVMQGQSVEEKVEGVLNFIYQLTDEMKYIFGNTELEYFSKDGLTSSVREQLDKTVEVRKGDTRIYLESGDYFSFRDKEIFFISGDIEEKMV